MTPAQRNDSDERLPPPMPLPARQQPQPSVEVRGLRFTRRDADFLATVLARCLAMGMRPGELLREVRRKLAEAGL